MSSLVSVIVPVFNAAPRLQICVQSLVLQTYEHIEIILIDDGSTDGSSYLCDELSDKYKNVIVYHKKNGGVSTARNLGLDYSSGQYIVFVDADDYLAPNGIDSMLKYIETNTADIAIAGKTIDYYGKRKKYLPLKEFKILKTVKDIANEIVYLNDTSNFDILWNKIYRASFIRSNNIRFEEFATTSQDLIFNVDCFKEKPTVVLIPDAYYFYYKGFEDTIVSRYHKEMYSIMKMRRKKNLELFELYSLNDTKSITWLNTEYIITIFNCIINMYRPGSNINCKERRKFIVGLYNDESLECSVALYNHSIGIPIRLFVLLFKLRLTILNETYFHVSYKLNQLIKIIRYR